MLAWALVGCDLLSPDFKVRNLIDRAQAACERRDGAAFHAILAEDYRGESGRNREETLHTIGNYLLVHRPSHCSTSGVVIKLRDDKTAHAEVDVTLSGPLVASTTDPGQTPAEQLHLSVDLTPDAEGQLQVTRARWQSGNTQKAAGGAGPTLR